jgi:hypothetical protein
LWVGAYLRRCQNEGLPAVVLRHGADEAGAIFVVVDRLDSTADLYAPAPQASFSESQPSDRLFQQVAQAEPLAAIDERIAREQRFDPDLWVVTIEDRRGCSLLDIV